MCEKISPAVPHLERHIRKGRRKLEEEQIPGESVPERIEALRRKIVTGNYGEDHYWGGAGVIIDPKEPRRATFNVLTGSVQSAKALSWLFDQVGWTLAPFVDHASKYGVYGDLAQVSIRFIKKCPNGYEISDLLMVVWNKMAAMYRRMVPVLHPFVTEKNAELDRTASWVAQYRQCRESVPAATSEAGGVSE
jgi:hypothetical protein